MRPGPPQYGTHTTAMALGSETCTIRARTRDWKALVVLPGTPPPVADRKQLESLREGQTDDGEFRWRFDPELSDEEHCELGYLLAQSHSWAYRSVLSIGMVAIIHIGFEPKTGDALKAGAERYATELAQVDESSPGAASAAVSAWVLRNLSSFSAVPTIASSPVFCPPSFTCSTPESSG